MLRAQRLQLGAGLGASGLGSSQGGLGIEDADGKRHALHALQCVALDFRVLEVGLFTGLCRLCVLDQEDGEEVKRKHPTLSLTMRKCPTGLCLGTKG